MVHAPDSLSGGAAWSALGSGSTTYAVPLNPQHLGTKIGPGCDNLLDTYRPCAKDMGAHLVLHGC